MTHGNTVWSNPPDHIVLRDNEVHVWRAMLHQQAQRMAALWQVMTENERCRAERFAFLRDRNHFIAARGMLRVILSRYSGLAPEMLQFQYGPYGKPYLEIEPGLAPLSFNLAHSDGVALYTIARGRSVGVDVERVRHTVNFAAIAEAYFSVDEYASLCELPAEAQPEAFFMCWTRKEAYVKARGEGLAYPLHQFDVSFLPGEPPALLRNATDPSEVARWRLYHCVPCRSYIGAIAVEGHDDSVRHWQAVQ